VPHSPSPPINIDDPSHVDQVPVETPHAQSRSPSPQAGSKRQHDTDEEENNSDVEEADVHVSKAPKVEKKSARPKAGDYDEVGKEMVLAAANIYRALLASQGAFPNTSTELKLIKKSWKLVNADTGVVPLALTPSIVTIVSIHLIPCYFTLICPCI
jgi:hypothetical protein